MVTERANDRLHRSQRVRSLGSLSSLHSFTPLSPSRPRSSSISESSSLTAAYSATLEAPHDWPFDTTYSARGFELSRDPFEGERRSRCKRTDSKGVGGGSKTTCRVLQEDGFITRMGATASMLGGWEGERRVEAWSSESAEQVYEDEDDDDDEFIYTRPSLHETRRQSSLAVFHDSNEHDSPPPLSRRSSLPSLNTSPLLTTSSLPPLTPTETPDIDTFAHAFLASQDRFGLFALVEAVLEFPFASKAPASPPPPESEYATPALSRVGSTYALASSEVDMEEGGGGGELGKYFRARSAGDLGRKEGWDEGEREERRGEKREVRDGLGAMIDVLAGLGSFV